MAVTDKLKGMVEELRHDLNEVKEQVRQLLPARSNSTDLPVRQQTSEHPIAALQRETNRLFDGFLRGTPGLFDAAFTPFGDMAGAVWPRVDVDESDRELRIKADLAGMDRDDIDVSVADGVLTIRGEKKHDDEDVGRHHYRRECFYGTFSRSIPVPADVDLDNIEAKMKKGVLQVTMPRLENRRSRGRRISVG
ncbi:MAG: Hsp20/alpha crystallin family protein [Candidatus Sulfomarinibacteraceae bacterium]